jgi:hypothetical protein
MGNAVLSADACSQRDGTTSYTVRSSAIPRLHMSLDCLLIANQPHSMCSLFRWLLALLHSCQPTSEVFTALKATHRLPN